MKSPPWEKDEFRIVPGTTKIDYDPNKDDINRQEKKYSLESAVDLLTKCISLTNARPYIFRDAEKTTSERRHEHMTIDSDGLIVFMVTTMREDETVRIISLRRAHEDERVVFTGITGYKENP